MKILNKTKELSEKFRAMFKSMETVGVMLSGCGISISGGYEGGVAAASRDGNAARIIFNTTIDFAGEGSFEGNIPIYWGLFTHELMHVLATDFDYENEALEKIRRTAENVRVSSLEIRERHMFSNIVEDPAIEYLSPEYCPGYMVKSLRKTIATFAAQASRIEEGRSAYEQLLSAMIQFGDLGVLNGTFTSKAAKEAFHKIAPIMDKAIEEPSFRKRFEYSQQCFEIARPLWEENMTDFAEAALAVEDLLRKFGKAEKLYGTGGASITPGISGKPQNEQDGSQSQRRKITLKRLAEEESGRPESGDGQSNGKDGKDGKDAKDGLPGSSGNGNSAGSSGNSGSPEGSGNAGAGESSENGRESSSGGNADDGTGADKGAFGEAIKELSEMSAGDIEKLRRIMAADGDAGRQQRNVDARTDIGDIDLSVKSPYVQKDISYQNTSSSVPDYLSLADARNECSLYVHGLTSRLRKIFQEDREKKAYRTSGRVSIKRIAGNRVTARVFQKKYDPENKLDTSVLILVDRSGSMCGGNIKNAVLSDVVIADTMAAFRIPTKTIGFCTNNIPEIIHYGTGSWKNTEEDRAAAAVTDSGGGTFLGFSIRYAGELLRKRPTKHKVLVIITDGYPEDSHYNNSSDAFKDIADALAGIGKFADVIGIGLFGNDRELRKTYQDLFKDTFLPLNDVSELPRLVADRMAKIVKEW